MNIEKLQQQILSHPDGVTLDVNGNIPNLTGFMVSITDNAMQELKAEKLKELVEQINSLTTDAFIGSWLDKQTKKLFVDISLNIKDINEARTLGKLFKQKAIFDLNNLDEIRL